MGRVLLEVIERYSIRSLLDAPCGDFMWMKELELPIESYVGIDIVEKLIELNTAQFQSPGRQFLVGDLTCVSLPKSDLVLCRDCLVHFSYADVFRALSNMKKSGSRFLLTTTFRRLGENHDIETGGWRALNLLRAPFCLPAPLAYFQDWCPDPKYSDKSFGLWDLTLLEV